MREYLLVFCSAVIATYLLTVVAREIALRSNAVAAIRDRDVHDEPIPYLGGVAMLGGLVAAYLVARQLPFLSTSSPTVARDALVVIVAGAMICAIGILDDIFELDALTKLGGQLLVAGFLVLGGVQFYYINGPNGQQTSLDPLQGALFTVFVVVATVNAVNFVDGLDGLAAGVVGLGAASFFFFCYTLTDKNNLSLATTGALLSACLAGACVGFLPHNFHPARIFMGDSGSMLIGLVLSATSITLTGQIPARVLAQDPGSWLQTIFPLLLPISILVVPMADLVLAVVRRTRAGRSPFAPDKQHLHHRMLEIGHSHRRAVLILWCWAALVGFSSALIGLYSGPRVWTAVTVLTVLTLAATFLLPIVHRPHLEAESAV